MLPDIDDLSPRTKAILGIVIAGCVVTAIAGGIVLLGTHFSVGQANATETQPTDEQTQSIEITNRTNTTHIDYPSVAMSKTIFWPERTVCTRWYSAQEGGVSCLPFNQTRADERFSQYAPDT